MEGKQEEVIHACIDGHNVLVLGQSGTGKSCLVKEISTRLSDLGKTVYLTGTTGVASLNIGGVTIHSWAGIIDGRFTDNELLHKIQTNEHYEQCKQNILNTDCLIIDEISMLSLKSFNQIEYICRKIRKADIYFGGIQVVASGDFFQLPPVPDPFKADPGDFCFLSHVFKDVFCHRIVLQKVIRQSESDFIKAISDVSRGERPQETLNLLTRLKRSLPPGESPIRLFARNFDKEIHNACCLMELDGEMHTYESFDDGDKKHLSKLPVSQTLHVKLQCPVMLVKNISKHLVNGMQGVVVEINTDTVIVNFNGSKVGLKREMFSIYCSINNKVIASRHQIPVVLAYGVTIHKSQGLTLERVIVDCSNIFKPGQLGVAIGRVTKKKRITTC